VTEPGVIWLNGTFGAGKTTIAKQILQLMPGWRIFDPEAVGVMLRTVMTREPVPDFQDWPPWRSLVAHTAVDVVRSIHTTLVTPMTLLREGYAEEIFGQLSASGLPFTHILLHADDHELRRRIEQSDEVPGDPAASERVRRWRKRHLDQYNELLPWLITSAHVIDTTALTPALAAQAVLNACGKVPLRQ
jgi:hypothetical protein